MGRPRSPKAPINTNEITRFGLVNFFIGKTGISPFYAMKCEVFLICSTLSLSWGCAFPICHPMVPPQRPKATKNTTKIKKFGISTFFVSKEKSSPIKTIKCSVFPIFPTWPPAWGGASFIRHPQGPPQSFKATKNTTALTRFGLPIFFKGNEGKSPLTTIKS